MNKCYAAIAAAVLLCAPQTAWAQDTKWEIEGHAGGAFLSTLNGGTATLPPGGETFVTFGGRSSQAVSSWYYGDGAALVNGAAEALDSFFGFDRRIIPIDALLDEPLAEQKTGWNVGGRVAYNFTPRFATEFSFDYASTPWSFTDAARTGLAASSDSYRAVFGELFDEAGQSDVSSAMMLYEPEASQLTATATLNVNLVTQGSFIPYVMGGGGVLWNRGDSPMATLAGHYAIDFIDFFPFEETDTVTLTQTIDETAPVVVFGGGFKWFVRGRSGLRFDVRVHLAKTTTETLLSADPAIMSGLPEYVIATMSDPSVQFSNAQTITGFPSSLSGPAVDGFTSLSVSQWQPRVLFSVGYFWGF